MRWCLVQGYLFVEAMMGRILEVNAVLWWEGLRGEDLGLGVGVEDLNMDGY